MFDPVAYSVQHLRMRAEALIYMALHLEWDEQLQTYMYTSPDGERFPHPDWEADSQRWMSGDWMPVAELSTWREQYEPPTEDVDTWPDSPTLTGIQSEALYDAYRGKS